jgi:hypothetical protein
MLAGLTGLLGGNGGAAGSYESIATAVGTGSSGSITFSSIPSTYKSLQIRFIANSSTNYGLLIHLNGDTAANYSYHRLQGNGSAAAAAGVASTSNTYVATSIPVTYSGAAIIDIVDYASTSKNKTIKTFYGDDTNGAGQVQLSSVAWYNTAAITSISLKLEASGSPLSTNSIFALYGIKG